MFEDWKLRRSALADVRAGVDQQVAVRRYVEAQLGARPRPDPTDPRVDRARAVVGNAATLDDGRSDIEIHQMAMPAGHDVLGIAMILLYAAEAYGCWDILESSEMAEESRAVVSLALSAFIAWMTFLAAGEAVGSAGQQPQTVKGRLLGMVVLAAFAIMAVALAAMRLGIGGSQEPASLAESVVMLAVTLGPAVALKAAWRRYSEGRRIAVALSQARSSFKAETATNKQAVLFLDHHHLAPSDYDAKAAVITARFLTEYDRAAAQHTNRGK